MFVSNLPGPSRPARFPDPPRYHEWTKKERPLRQKVVDMTGDSLWMSGGEVG